MISLSNLLLFIPSVHLPFIFSMFIFFSAFFSSLSYLSFLSFCSLPFPPKIASPLSSLSLSFTSLCLHSFIFHFHLFPILFSLSILPFHSPCSFPTPFPFLLPHPLSTPPPSLPLPPLLPHFPFHPSSLTQPPSVAPYRPSRSIRDRPDVA